MVGGSPERPTRESGFVGLGAPGGLAEQALVEAASGVNSATCLPRQ